MWLVDSQDNSFFLVPATGCWGWSLFVNFSMVDHPGIATLAAAHARPPNYTFFFEFYEGGNLADALHVREWSPSIHQALSIMIALGSFHAIYLITVTRNEILVIESRFQRTSTNTDVINIRLCCVLWVNFWYFCCWTNVLSSSLHRYFACPCCSLPSLPRYMKVWNVRSNIPNDYLLFSKSAKLLT